MPVLRLRRTTILRILTGRHFQFNRFGSFALNDTNTTVVLAVGTTITANTGLAAQYLKDRTSLIRQVGDVRPLQTAQGGCLLPRHGLSRRPARNDGADVE